MGNTNQKASGTNKKKNSDDNVMVQNLEQQLQLFKDNPVFIMLSKFKKQVEQQVQLFKANHVLSKFDNLLTWQTVDSPPLKLQAEKKQTNSLVYAVGGYFILKWAWAKWNEQRTKKKSSDDPF